MGGGSQAGDHAVEQDPMAAEDKSQGICMSSLTSLPGKEPPHPVCIWGGHHGSTAPRSQMDPWGMDMRADEHAHGYSSLCSQPAEGHLWSRAMLAAQPRMSCSHLRLEMPKGALEQLQRVQSDWPAGQSLSGRGVPPQPTEKRWGEGRGSSGCSPVTGARTVAHGRV